MTAEHIERCQEWLAKRSPLSDDQLVRSRYSAASALEDGVDVGAIGERGSFAWDSGPDPVIEITSQSPASNAANAPS